MLFIVGQVLPYIAGGIFLIGVIGRLMGWLKVGVPFQLTLFPAPTDGLGRVTNIGTEMVLFKSLYNNNKSLWFWAWMFHVALAMIIIGHAVGIYFQMHQFTLIGLSAKASEATSAFFGTIAGIIAVVTLVWLFYRRISDPMVKQLSDPRDYFDLILIFAVVFTGNHLRFAGGFNMEVLEAIRTYMGNLLTFSPTPIPNNGVFVAHFFFVQLLLIYFPFSKLMHLVGIMVNRAMLVEAEPVYPTPAGQGSRSPYVVSKPTAPPLSKGV